MSLPNLDENVKTFIDENSVIIPKKKEKLTRKELLLKLKQKNYISSGRRLSKYAINKKLTKINKKNKK